jgi:hypothetical protein
MLSSARPAAVQVRERGTLLRRNRGGIATTAQAAMIDAATLHRKMKLHALRREDFREKSKA